MDTKPKPLTDTEITEIASIPTIQQLWGATDRAQMTEQLKNGVYAVKFDYMTVGPGYAGDLFILMGDALQGPVRLIRVKGKLEIYG